MLNAVPELLLLLLLVVEHPGDLQHRPTLRLRQTEGLCHRIIDDGIEKSIKGRRIGHCAFAASIFKMQRLRQY